MNPYINSMRLTTAFVFVSITAGVAAGESLTYDPNTGVYTMEYYNTYDQAAPVQKRARFELRTRIDPVIKSKVKEKEPDKNLLSYRYEIKNGTASKQNIDVVRLVGSHSYAENISVPSGWRGSVKPTYVTRDIIAGWSYRADDAGGLKPGATQPGFGFESRDLPGVGIFESIGNARRDLGGFPDLGPSSDTPVGQQFSELMQNNESVRRFAAAPKIPNPTPFNAAVVLGGMQKHVKDDMASMQLIDPALAALVDRGLTQAIAAAQGGNTPSLLHEIKSLRQLLKQEHADVDQDNDGDDDDKDKKPKPRIAKLAAKVLDFDLKYVEKRI